MNNNNLSNILIVDDNIDNLKLVSELLKTEGYIVRVAKNGANAITAIKSSMPDIILLDIMMPDFNGYEVCQQIKEMETVKDIPVIFMTALTENESKALAFQSGGIDYITKPIQTEEVLTCIKTHLDLRKLNRELTEKDDILKHKNSELDSKQVQLRDALINIKKLEDIMPICSQCKSSGDHDGFSNHVDVDYLSADSKLLTQTEKDKIKILTKYAKVKLSDNKRKEFAEKLENYMINEQAFLNDEISIPLIAKELDIPHHFLSMTINIEFCENFFNYINRYRIRYAEKLLKDADEKEESILMIAYRSGFQTKTSFNKAFKLFTGSTPSEYRKQHNSQNV